MRRTPSPHFQSLVVDLALLAAVAGVLVLGLIRLDSALRSAAYFQSTGAEAPGLYGIAVVARGDPLYHELTTNPTTLVFGYSFYLLYGEVARLLGLSDAQVVRASKAITFAAAVAITAALIALTRPWWRGLPRRAL